MSQNVTVGRIVHYVPEKGSAEAIFGAKVLAAITVAVWGGGECAVNLKVFTDGPHDTWRTFVNYSEANEPNTWHWPPR